jgi:hypothetical protein
MTKFWRAMALLAGIVMATAASAQYPGGRGGPGGPTGARGGAGERAGEPPAGMRGAPSAVVPLNLGAFVEVQLDQLEDELKLTPTQSAAWIAYAERIGKFADDIVRSQFEARAARATSVTAAAPEQLGLIADGMRNRLKAIDEIVALGTALYATLTPEQRVVADRRLAQTVAILTAGATTAGMAAPTGRDERARRP